MEGAELGARSLLERKAEELEVVPQRALPYHVCGSISSMIPQPNHTVFGSG